MASKYLQKYPVPEGFHLILHDFAREVLRDQPDDIIKCGADYFECMAQGKEFKFESKYNIAKGEAPGKVHKQPQPSNATEKAKRVVDKSNNRPESQNKQRLGSGNQNNVSRISSQGSYPEEKRAAKEYVNDLYEKIAKDIEDFENPNNNNDNKDDNNNNDNKDDENKDGNNQELPQLASFDDKDMQSIIKIQAAAKGKIVRKKQSKNKELSDQEKIELSDHKKKEISDQEKKEKSDLKNKEICDEEEKRKKPIVIQLGRRRMMKFKLNNNVIMKQIFLLQKLCYQIEWLKNCKFVKFKSLKINQLIMYQNIILLKEEIGEGFSSNLHLCDYKGKQSVIKIYKQNYLDNLRKKEIKILKSLDHPHILKMVDNHPDYNYFICDQLKTDFFTIVQNQKRLDVRAVKQILLDLGEAIQYLHKPNYVHRDIKLENVMLDNNLQIILIDFGFADYVDDQKQNVRQCGTQNYMSPELLISQKYIKSNLLKKSDIFALAVLIFILYFGFPPFSEATVKCPFWKFISENKWETFWKIVNRNSKLNDIVFQELFENMISPNLENRYTIEQVLDHPWIDGNHDLSYLINII